MSLGEGGSQSYFLLVFPNLTYYLNSKSYFLLILGHKSYFLLIFWANLTSYVLLNGQQHPHKNAVIGSELMLSVCVVSLLNSARVSLVRTGLECNRC